MCSIFGVLDIKTDAVELRKKALELSRLMRHRGPDWSGVYASDKAILVHERLSIVDVNAGAQPLYNAQKTHALAVNGEIYNHQALRAEYGDRYTFQTGSDCEVILALYQEKGAAFRISATRTDVSESMNCCSSRLNTGFPTALLSRYFVSRFE